MRDRLRFALEPATRARALRVSVVVGSILNLINHYDLLLGTPPATATWIQIALTFLVPYCVSTHGQVWWRTA